MSAAGRGWRGGVDGVGVLRACGERRGCGVLRAGAGALEMVRRCGAIAVDGGENAIFVHCAPLSCV